MILVLFELTLQPGRQADYLGTAERLRPLLDGADGFLSIERFESLGESGRLLSLSCWRDEEAVRQWRISEVHRQAQDAGRRVIFADYRLRVAQVLRDYGMHDREQAPPDARRAVEA